MSNNAEKIELKTMRNKIIQLFLTGILIIAPVLGTVYLLIWIFQLIDGILQPLLVLVFKRTIPGIGFVLTITLVLMVGLIANSVTGRSIIGYLQSLLSRMPIVQPIYNTMKQIADSFSESKELEGAFSDVKNNGFTKVVLVEYPRKGMRAIGIVTNEVYTSKGEKFLGIYLPGTPNPAAGFFQIVRESEVIPTKLSVNEAMKIIISAGRVNLKEAAEGWPDSY